MSNAALQSLLAHKAWADDELLSLLATVPPEHGQALHTGLRLMNHIHVVDRLFQAHLSSGPAPFAATNTSDTPSLAALHEQMRSTDAWLCDHLAQLPAQRLSESINFRFTDGDAGRMSREEMLLHLASHGAYHRGNVGQVLRSINIAPPRDLYTRFLHLSEPARRSAAT